MYFETAFFDPMCRFVPTFEFLNGLLLTRPPTLLNTNKSGEKSAVSGEKSAVRFMCLFR
jgi:hypothetical protein